jgi:hypothetical protein
MGGFALPGMGSGGFALPGLAAKKQPPAEEIMESVAITVPEVEKIPEPVVAPPVAVTVTPVASHNPMGGFRLPGMVPKAHPQPPPPQP